jgi:transcriptional regulator with XRE-family HTH domain
MPNSQDNHDCAERIRERLPRHLQELREAAGFTKYGLAHESGVSREYLGKIGRGVANPTVPVAAWISHELGRFLAEPRSGFRDAFDSQRRYNPFSCLFQHP